MAETNAGDAMREEVGNLRAMVENLIKTIDSKKTEIAGDALGKMQKELDYYRQKAAQEAGHLRDMGEAGLDTVTDQVRRNPLMSILVAFGAGCIVATLFRGMR